MAGFVSRTIISANRWHLLICVLIALGGAGALLTTGSMLLIGQQTPKLVAAAAFEALPIDSPIAAVSEWGAITFEPSEVINLGKAVIYKHSRKKAKTSTPKISGYYYAAVIGGKQVLLLTSEDAPPVKGTPLVGTFLPSGDHEAREAFPLFNTPDALARGPVFTGLVFDMQPKSSWMIMLFAALSAIVLVSGVWGALKAVLAMVNIGQHPAVARLPIVAGSDRRDLLGMVDELFGEQPGNTDDEALFFAPGMALYQQGVQVDLLPYSQLAWLYLTSEEKRFWIFIVLGTKHTLNLHLDNGTHYKWDMGSRLEQAQALLQALAARAPAAFTEHTDMLESLWKNNRAEFLAAVAQKRTIAAI